jgi:hypothetical protein
MMTLLCTRPVRSVVAVLAILGGGCSNHEGRSRMSEERAGDYKRVGLAFAKALASRDYDVAYAMTSRDYRDRTSLKALQAAFERIVPVDWKTVGPIEVGKTMEDWPGRELSDVGWAYVSVGGDLYSEAVTVVVTREEGELKVRTVEFGRP